MVILRSGSLIVVGSLALSLVVSSSPPPDTLAVLVTIGCASLATSTVSVMSGKPAPAASTADAPVRVQERFEQFQPEPAISVADRPAGSVSVTVTVEPSVGDAPAFVAFSV